MTHSPIKQRHLNSVRFLVFLLLQIVAFDAICATKCVDQKGRVTFTDQTCEALGITSPTSPSNVQQTQSSTDKASTELGTKSPPSPNPAQQTHPAGEGAGVLPVEVAQVRQQATTPFNYRISGGIYDSVGSIDSQCNWQGRSEMETHNPNCGFKRVNLAEVYLKYDPGGAIRLICRDLSKCITSRVCGRREPPRYVLSPDYDYKNVSIDLIYYPKDTDENAAIEKRILMAIEECRIKK